MRDWNDEESEEEEEDQYAQQQVPEEDFKANTAEGEEEESYPEVLAATGEEPALESPAVTGEKGASGFVQGEDRQERRRYDNTERGGRGVYRGRGGYRGGY